MLHPSPTATVAAAFVEKWEHNPFNESAASKEHFVDLCRLLGQMTPNDQHGLGNDYRFEKPLTKVGGSAGFADVWRRNAFAWEYKSKGKYRDLREAYLQLLQYKEDLDNPPILAACDIARYEVHIAFTGHKTRIERFTNADIATVSTRELLHLVFTNPEQLRPIERVETVTEQAAAKLAAIAQLIEQRGVSPEQIAPFFTKLLFAFFAEDIGLLPNHLVSASLKQTIAQPETFVEVMQSLFRVMQTGGYYGPLSRVPRFNGGLFDDDTVVPLTANEIHLLYAAARLDWQDVEPAIFGTLFERSIAPGKRAQLGLHYTSKQDILALVEPVLMTPLRRQWVEVQRQIESLRPQWEAATGPARQRLQNRMEGYLLDIAEHLATTTVLDPAVGSGNFLYVALQQLKGLEKEVWGYAGGIGLTQPILSVSPTQLYGIEKDPYAAALAQVVVWIGYWQWLRKNGFWNPTEPIIERLDTIRCHDALLIRDAEGQLTVPEWPKADVIIGNPPFLGDKRMRAELGDGYVDNLRAAYADQVSGGADLVTYWFARTHAHIAKGHTKRAGLLATNSIRFGANRRVLDAIKADGDIFLAWSDRPWVLDGADVRVSMVGFDDGTEQERLRDGVPTAIINADLTTAVDVTQARALHENVQLVFLGMMKAGPFDLDPTTAKAMLCAPTNANGRSNCDVVRRRLGGQDITGRLRDGWIIDFGVDMSEADAATYALPFAHVQTHVKPLRDVNRRASMRRRWWIHGEPRRNLRQALTGLHRCIVTPEVAKHRLFVWMSTTTIPDHTCHVIARDDDYCFGVLHSRIHEWWSLAVCNYMGVGNDPRYNSSRTFGTFPFPWAPGQEPQDDPRVEAIAEAARDLVTQRDAWLNEAGLSAAELKQRTLTNLYNKRPDWLDLAHQALDAAVCDAYGWAHDLTKAQTLERLLTLNLARTVGQADESATTILADNDLELA